MAISKLSRCLVGVAVIQTAIVAGSLRADDTPPAVIPVLVEGRVQSAGEMRNVMQKGDLSPHFDLAALKGQKGLYALGPVAGLQGEITVLDGKSYVTTLRDGKPVVDESWPKASFLVYVQVSNWQAVQVPDDVKSLAQLEAFIAKAARAAGVDIGQPFPFRVTGTPERVKYHVIWKTDGLPHTKELHQKAKLSYELMDREVEMVGFYSHQHQGVFTHHDSNIHVHVRTRDGKEAGHVDETTFARQTKLHLPVARKPEAEPRRGRGGRDELFTRDRDTFHFLLDNHKSIKRTVKKLDNGVETVTESDTPEVARKIQEHVPAMYERLKSGNGVRYWDPLFAEAFKHGKKMKLEITNTTKGVKVIETSDDPAVVKIIQAHAEVVSKFVDKGFEEAHQEHPVPAPEKKK